MKHTNIYTIAIYFFKINILLLSCLLSTANASTQALLYQDQFIKLDGDTHKVRVPMGYLLELLTDKLDRPRLLNFDGRGSLVIGSKSDVIYRLSPPYTQPEELLELDGYPHSVAFRQNEIFIATTDGLYQAPYTPGIKKINPGTVKKLASVPGGGGHNSRTVGVGPDGRVYLSLGISGNCSDEYLGKTYSFDHRRGGVMVLDEKGAKPVWQTFGSGLRNPVGFAWHPVTGVMYASNNGPDHQGFEKPPEYFSRIEAGSFHGMPWFQYDGSNVKRDDCIDNKPPRPIKDVSVPVATFAARNAPMGVSFVPKGAMDKTLEFDAIVALRGSWGTKPGGGFFGANATRRHPKLVVVRFENGKAHRVDDLVTGFQLENGDRLARPVGVAIGPDGALYFTSDSGVNGLFRLRKK
ncbi:MAG: sugar dehydrogenase [Gammaproteobacteria bacterium]|nr:sugar dehydrogenase [Gammaproteobacteria bacterium]